MKHHYTLPFVFCLLTWFSGTTNNAQAQSETIRFFQSDTWFNVIAKAQEECDKLQKEKEKAAEAEKKGSTSKGLYI